MIHFNILQRMIVLTLILLLGLSATAQTYPTRPIKIIVPATPGGAIDQIARSLADELTVTLGQSDCVEQAECHNNLNTSFNLKWTSGGGL